MCSKQQDVFVGPTFMVHITWVQYIGETNNIYNTYLGGVGTAHTRRQYRKRTSTKYMHQQLLHSLLTACMYFIL